MSSDKAIRAAVAGRNAAGRLADPVSGKSVQMTEARRVSLAMEAVRSLASVPPGVSDQVAPSPARGATVAFVPRETYLTEAGPRVRREPMRSGAPVRLVSPLERLEVASRSRKGGPVFTVAQHLAADAYAALFEAVHGGRVKCVDLNRSGGGDAAGVMDAVVHDIQRLRRMDRAIGHEAVLAPRGPRAQDGRRVIRADQLVRWAVVAGDPLAGLLRRHGWDKQTRYMERLQRGLAGALDRLHGL